MEDLCENDAELKKELEFEAMVHRNEKYCKDCDSWKPLDEFWRQGKNRFGDQAYSTVCAECMAEKD